MPIEIVPFEPKHLEAVIRFSEKTWTRPRTDDFYRWRYLTCPSQIGILALSHGECLAMVWAFVQSYQIGPQRLSGLETFDWFCAPEFRGSGLGIRVLQAMMNRPELIIAAGGSQDTVGLLPRLQWRTHHELLKFLLPFEGAVRSRDFKRRFGLPTAVVQAILSAKRWVHSRLNRAIEGGEVSTASEVGPEVLALYAKDTGYGTVRVPNPRFISWLRSGLLNRVQFLPLYFRIHDELRGWSLTRIYKTASGCEANIIELFAPHVGADIYAWMVAETVSAIASHRPDGVYAAASLPVLQQALRRNGFIGRGTHPMHVRWLGPGDLLQPICLTNNTADEALLPYPTD